MTPSRIKPKTHSPGSYARKKCKKEKTEIRSNFVISQQIIYCEKL